jgi:DNA-binding response OmpR family regulator
VAKKILVIEDSLLLSQILEEALHKKGYEVITAYDGKGGLLKASACKPDIVLLDLVLPDISGEEVCRNLKKYPDTERTPVIMLSGKDSDTDRVVGKVIGAQAYISKPFDLEVLFFEIAKLIAVVIFAISVFFYLPVLAADTNEIQQVPPGMDVIKVGEHTVYVAQGTKVTQRGSQLILEPPDEFVARKILLLEDEIAALKIQQQQLSLQIEDMKKSLERLKPLVGTEAGSGPK